MNNMPYKFRQNICVVCKKSFYSKSNVHPKYCSRICFYLNLKINHPFKGKHHSDKTKCVISLKSKLQKNRDISGLISPEARKRSSEFCKAKRGRPNPAVSVFQLAHPNKVNKWHIRSPSGIAYKILNLKKWCRENSHYFENWERAYKGISKLGVCSKWTIPTQWRGWTFVSESERINNKSEDILCRKLNETI